ncbi:MAG: hypothetical protein WEA09_14645 [Gemmatimonadota bacterium]
MKTLGIYFLAGVAALLALKVVLAILAPVIALAFGVALLALPLALVLALGWCVMRILAGSRPQET